MKFTIYILFILLLFHNKGLTQSVPRAQPNFNAVTTEEFEGIRKAINYPETKMKLVPKRKAKEAEKNKNQKKHKEQSNSIFSELLFEILIYTLIILLAAGILFTIFSNLKIEKQIDSQNVKKESFENIDEIDAESAYTHAVENGHFRRAIRMRFIKTLQILSDQKEIDWKINKTNRNYIIEIANMQKKENFRFLVTMYERVWYGNKEIGASEFHYVDEYFQTFITGNDVS